MELYNKLSDQDLTKLLRSGDEKAFNEIYERFNGLLYVYAKKMVKDSSEAQDLVQEVFMSIWNRSESLEMKSSLSSYLYTALRYKFLDLVARRKIRSDYAAAFQDFINEGTYSTDEYINEKELMEQVEKEVARLPEKMRRVFELSRNEGLSHKEIAQMLDLADKTVKSHINHALKILRDKIGLFALLLYLFKS